MSDLTKVIPFAMPVSLGGLTVMVMPLRLREFAQLQAWLNRVVPSPLEDARAAIQASEGDDRRKLLADVFERSLTWPVRYGSGLGSQLFGSQAGARFFLAVAMSRADRVFSQAELDAMLGKITPDEWRQLSAILFGSNPIDEVVRMLDPAPDVPSEDLNWAQAFAEVAESTGWTFEQLADLTLSQWIAIRSGGKPSNPFAPRPGESIWAADKRRRRLLYGAEDAISEAERAQLRAAAALFPEAVLPEGV